MDTEPGKDGKNRRQKKSGEIEVDDDDDEEYVPRRKKMESKLSKEDEIFQQKKEEIRKSKVQNIWGQEVMAVTDAYIEHTVKRDKVRPKTVNVGKADTSAVMVPHS